LGVRHSAKFACKYDLRRKTPEIANENNYTPVKISCTWNQAFSVFYAVIADIRDLCKKETKRDKINKEINTLVHKWDTHSAEPPYMEAISRYFTNTFMRKQKEPKIKEKKNLMNAKLNNIMKKKK